jgi:hypothetical protein
MSFLRLYLRVLGLLGSEVRIAMTLALANIALAGRNSSNRCYSAVSSTPCRAHFPRESGRPRELWRH